MEISFISKKLEKEFNEGTRLVKVHGPRRAKKIRIRLAELQAAITLYDFWPPKRGLSRCHELAVGDRKGKFHLTVDLDLYSIMEIPEGECGHNLGLGNSRQEDVHVFKREKNESGGVVH